MKLHLGAQGHITNLNLVNLNTGEKKFAEGYEKNEPIFNRIVDSGLDMPASHFWEGCFHYMSCGSGTSPTLDSMTKLENYLYHSASSVYSDILNGYSYDITEGNGHVLIWRTRTIFTNNTGADVLINEIGVHPDDTADADVFARILLPSTITVPDGISLQATYTLKINYPSITNAAVPNSMTMNINGIDVIGKEILIVPSGWEYSLNSAMLKSGIIGISSSGDGKTAGACFEPSAGVGTGFNDMKGALGTSESETSFSGNVYHSSGSKISYVAGSFQIGREFIFSASNNPGVSFDAIAASGSYSSSSYCPTHYFYSPTSFVKNIGREWKLTQTLSWGRTS